MEIFRISSATIRNVMSDLEDSGFIAQPHASSGRIPTELGLRYYVDNLLDLNKIKEEEESKLVDLKDAYREKIAFVKSILIEYSRILSKLSNYPGLLLLKDDASLYKKIQFLKIDDKTILITLISSAGTVTNEYLKTDINVSQEELNSISLLLNNQEIPFTIDDLNKFLKKIIDTELNITEKNIYDDLLFIEGIGNIFQHKEFSLEPSKLKNFIELLETKKIIGKILNEFLHASNLLPSVKIGHELKGLEELEICIAGVPICKQETRVGFLGLIGPMRMEYGKVLALLEMFNKSFDSSIK
jgi:heat-inducible transcriptional repressor